MSRKHEMTAPSAGNVHVPGPRTRARNGFEVSHDTEHEEVLVHDVPLFDVHNDSTAPKPYQDIDDTRLQEILEHTQWQQKAGRYPRLIVGHTSTDDSPTDQWIVGRVENTYIKPNPDLDGRPTIYGDFRVDKGFYEFDLSEGRFPGRSIELEAPDEDEPNNGFYISNVALLRATTPARPLRDMGKFARYQADARGVTISRFQSQEIDMSTMTAERLADLIEGADEETLARFAKKFGVASGDDKATDDLDEGKSKKKKKKNMKDDDGHEGEEFECDDKGKKSSKAAAAAHYARLQTEIDALKSENEDLRKRTGDMQSALVRREVEHQAYALSRNGIKLGENQEEVESEIERLCKIEDDDARKAEFARIEKHYARVPVNRTVDKSGLDKSAPDAGGDGDAAKLDEESKAYAKEHKVPYYQAQKEVVRQWKADGRL